MKLRNELRYCIMGRFLQMTELVFVQARELKGVV
jgi:hypothetical protein